nr:unnamed protein product [Callosobruchus chinensis]
MKYCSQSGQLLPLLPCL